MIDPVLSAYLSNQKTSSFQDILFKLIAKKNTDEVSVYKTAQLDRKLFSKIRCQEDYVPKKKNVIKLGLALNLDKSDFNMLLHSAGYYLGGSNFDNIISYCLDNKIYDTKRINDYLYNYCTATL